MLIDEEIIENRIREIKDKWKMEMDKLENEKEALEGRIRDLEDQLTEAKRGLAQKQSEVEGLMRKNEVEIAKLKNEIQRLHERYNNELDDEREARERVRAPSSGVVKDFAGNLNSRIFSRKFEFHAKNPLRIKAHLLFINLGHQ